MSRTSKQIIYGLLYASFWAVIVYGGYRVAIRPAPSCVDAIRNRDEQAVDCGGVYCISCEIKNLKNVQFSQLKFMATPEGDKTTVLAELRNPNAAYGTSQFAYRVAVYGTSTSPLFSSNETTAIYPGEVKYRLFINIPLDPKDVTRVEATSTARIEWRSITDFSKPKTPIRDLKTTYTVGAGRAVVTGILKNDNPYQLSQVTLAAILASRSGVPLAVSKTAIRDVIASEERFFQIIIPLPADFNELEMVDAKVFADAVR